MKIKPTSAHWQPALIAHSLSSDACVEGLADIGQAIQIILRTPHGSDPHRPTFGSNLYHYIDYPIDRAIPHVVRESVGAIKMWEPRCEVLKVEPVVSSEHLTLRVNWRVADGVINITEMVWR